jgi:enterochelin esterase family protein
VRSGELALTKQQDGLFEGVLPWDESHTGPMSVGVLIDGTLALDPYMPIFGAFRPHNVVEIPDADMEFIFINDVPHGAIGREIYRSGVLKSSERCTVYTPPGYMKSNRDYPVLYLQHGGNENETVWEHTGKVGYILDNLIAAGKAEPFIVVMNNDMLRYSGSSGAYPVDTAFERLLIEDCIPYIEKNYRVRTGKWNRALAGLSMGSMMSCDIAYRHPELFGNLGTLTASMTHETFSTTYERPFPTVMKDAKKFAANYKVYFRSTTPQEDHYSDYFIADDRLCADSGIDKLPGYRRIVYPARTTKWNSWRLGLRDFAPLLFR